MVDEIRASELGGGREGERLELEGVEKCELQGQCRQELCGEEGGGMMVMEVMEVGSGSGSGSGCGSDDASPSFSSSVEGCEGEGERMKVEGGGMIEGNMI